MMKNPVAIKTEADKILIVDDEPSIRKLLVKYLSDKNYAIETADNGKVAIEKLQSESFDLVLTDLRMPKMGGRELLQIMSENFPDIPKIVFTGHGTNEDIILALQTGAYDFLTKPITDFGMFDHTIQRAIDRKKLNDERKRYLSQVNQINEIISMLNRGRSTEEIFNTLNTSLKKIIPFNTLALMLINLDSDEVSPRYMSNEPRSITMKGAVFTLKDKLLKKIMESREVLSIDNIPEFASRYPNSRLIELLELEGYKSMIILPIIVNDITRGFLLFAAENAGIFIRGHIAFLESIGGQISFSIERGELVEEINRYTKNLEQIIDIRTKEIMKTQLTTILTVAKVAEVRDHTTGDHLERIRSYCVLLTQLRKYIDGDRTITNQFIRNLYYSSILHDIGKVGIPDTILLKKDILTPEERTIMKSHTDKGFEVLNSASHDLEKDSFLNMAMDITLCHHERWDGSGYPRGLKGKDIPLSARIVAIADVYDALTTERSYKKALSHEDSIAIMKNESLEFDPELFRLFYDNAEAFNDIRTNKEM
jgi:response regulator RpfG family c-di-GMP phosphodiesterase